MIEYQFGGCACISQGEIHDRVVTGLPAARAPSLHDALSGPQFQMPARDVAPEQDELATQLGTD
jgi:hypothetical protein